LKSVSPKGGAEAGRADVAEQLGRLSAKSLLLYVHGYNTSFTDAAFRTAQLAYDLAFPGVAMFYSWPSAGKSLSYWQDEETAQLSEGTFPTLFEDALQLPFDAIYVIAEGMGARIVGHAVEILVTKQKVAKSLRELILVAPDVNAELFRSLIAPKLAA